MFHTDGSYGRQYQDFLKLTLLPATERYKLDQVLKDRLRLMGFNMTLFYPPAGSATADDVTYYADSTLITADGLIA